MAAEIHLEEGAVDELFSRANSRLFVIMLAQKCLGQSLDLQKGRQNRNRRVPAVCADVELVHIQTEKTPHIL